MMTLGNVVATIEHAAWLGPRLRQADVLEVEAASGVPAADALVQAVQNSWQAHTWMLDGQPLFIAGVVGHPDDEKLGIPWMLASDEADRHPRRYLAGAHEYVKSFFERHDTLLNFVDNRNIKAQRWLHWLGFQIGDPRPFGVAGLPFRPFWMDKGALGVPRQGTINFVSHRGQPCVTP